MKCSFLLTAILLASSAAPGLAEDPPAAAESVVPAPPVVIEEIVARVNDKIITKSLYERREAAMLRELAARLEGADLERLAQESRQTLLRDMVNEILVSERAAELGIDVSEEELKGAIERVKQDYGLREDAAFQAALQRNGVSPEELSDRLRVTVLTNKVLAREVQSKVTLTEEEVRERFERDKAKWAIPEKVELREILIPASDPADATARIEAERTAAHIAGRLAAGDGFELLLREHAKSESDGNMGAFARGELAAPLDEAVWQLRDGGVTPAIEVRGALHIIQRVRTIPASSQPFEGVREALRATMLDEAFRKKLETYLADLRGDFYVKIYSSSVAQ